MSIVFLVRLLESVDDLSFGDCKRAVYGCSGRLTRAVQSCQCGSQKLSEVLKHLRGIQKEVFKKKYRAMRVVQGKEDEGG